MYIQQLFKKPPTRIAALYIIIASAWILLSDTVLYSLGVSAVTPAASMMKGIAFVAVTATILYLYSRREFRLRFRIEAELHAQIADARRSQAALEQSEARFRKAIEEAPFPIMMFAEDGDILTISQTWLDITGYTRDQLRTIPAWTELAYGERKEQVLAVIDRLFDSDSRVDQGEFTITCADGTSRNWEFSSTPLGRLPDERRIAMSIAADVTARKQTSELLQTIFDNIPVMISLVDQEGRFRLVNQHWIDVLGWTIAEMEAYPNVMSLFYPAPADRQAALNHIQAADQSWRDFRTLTKDGRVVDTSWANVRLSDGHIISIGKDITERKQLENTLRESEERLSLFIEHAPVSLAMFDREMRYLAVSRRWIMDYRLSEGDIIGRSHYAISPEISERWKAAHQLGLAGEVVKTEEDKFERADGSIQWLHWEIYPWHINNGAIGGIIIFSEDITERKQLENTLRESELRFRQIAETIHEVFFLRDANKHSMLYVSPAYEGIWGRPREDLYQASSSFLDTIHPDDRARVVAGMELQRRGQQVEAVYRIIRPDHKIRWIRSQTFPVFDTHGTLSRIAGAASDITEQVRYENQLKRLSQRLVAVLDNERARIARELHDQVGQQLTGLGINLSVVEMQCTQDNRAIPLLKESTELISQIIERIRFIIADLRPFVLDDMGLVAGLRWYCQTFTRRTGIVVDFNNTLESTQLSPETNNTLFQIAQETLTNVAKHAQATQVWITLELTGNQLTMKIRDNGTGFDMQSVLAGNSVGHWGIQIMHERIQALVGASLHVTSTPGEGTMVLVEVQL